MRRGTTGSRRRAASEGRRWGGGLVTAASRLEDDKVIQPQLDDEQDVADLRLVEIPSGGFPFPAVKAFVHEVFLRPGPESLSVLLVVLVPSPVDEEDVPHLMGQDGPPFLFCDRERTR